MLYISAFTPLIIILISVGLGLPARNWFLEFGLAVVVISSITTIALAIQSARAATKAEKWTFDDFLPKVDDGISNNFKFTAGIMGVDSRNPVDHLRRQIDELQRTKTARFEGIKWPTAALTYAWLRFGITKR